MFDLNVNNPEVLDFGFQPTGPVKMESNGSWNPYGNLSYHFSVSDNNANRTMTFRIDNDQNPIYSASFNRILLNNRKIANMSLENDISTDQLKTVLNVPTKLSDLTNDSGFINKDVNNLTYYPLTTSLKSVAFSGAYNDLTGKPTIPTKVSDLTNDSGFIDKSVTNLYFYTKTSDLARVATTGLYSDLSGRPVVPTKTSDLTNDSGFINKNVNDLTNYTKTSSLASVALSGNYSDLTNKPTIPTKTSDLVNDRFFVDKDVYNLTYYTKTEDLADVALSGSYNDLSDKPTIPTVPTKTSDLVNDSGFINKDVNNLTYYTKSSSLATVAISGSYNDLSNKPSIPTKTSDITNDSGYITSSAVKDSTVTIQKNGINAGSFTLNKSTDTTININGIEEMGNKVITLSSSSTNTQYPSAKCVYDVTEDIREIAAGKSHNYVCSAITNPELNSQNDVINLINDLVDINGNTIRLSDLKIGDSIYITQTDIPDRWYAGAHYLYKLETSKVPVTDVKKNGVSVVSNTVADIIVPTKTSDITNDSDYITSSYHDSTKQNVIDSSNKLSSDLVDDTDKTNKFVTQAQKNAINTALQPNDNVSALQNDAGYLTEHQSLSAYRTSSDQDIIDATKENTSNKVTSISSASTNTQYPSAKCVYDIVGNIEATLQAIRGV